ncbi:SymE family type I addiction module toxin [Klebsiella aerogenes]|nr:SymE family type I addiction module toxin [Klebsiella aerogenes]
MSVLGDWLIEAGFGTGTFVTVKVTEDCLVLIANNSEEQLYQAKQVVKGIRDVIV